MDNKNIFEKIKMARIQRFLTNCYSLDIVEHSQQVWTNEDEFLFSYKDHGIDRLIFFAKTWEGVDWLLNRIDQGKYFLEFMTKNPEEYIPGVAVPIAAMKRMSNTDCRRVFESGSSILQYRNSADIELAKESDAEEINGILWSSFHMEISHLLTDDELREKIRAGQVTVHRNMDNNIDALLQAEVMPKKFYINQVVNKGNRKNIHAILLHNLEKYVNAGGKYLYAWIEESNVASIKFHEKYGMKHDNMWSMIYSIER